MRVTPGQAAAHFHNAARLLGRAILDAERESVQEAYKEAIRLSQGGYSLARLAQMGHPYAKAHPNPPQDAAIINAQERVFLRSWFVSQPIVTSDGTYASVFNTAPHAIFLFGTSLMIARPIWKRIAQRVEKSRRARLWNAIVLTLYPRY
jgi:hypothetical protein